jgi:ATP adenylyltransferase
MAKAKGGGRRLAAGREPARGKVPARLWAPWRMAFIEGEKPKGCIFCRFPAEGIRADRSNLIVHRSARAFTLLNRYPYNSGHVMVVPRAHVAKLEALGQEEFQELHEELLLASRVVRAVYRPEGMNIGMNLGHIAGAGIADHLHYHVVPRWAGDTNFMPVLFDTRVMVEHLDQAFLRLRRGFEER